MNYPEITVGGKTIGRSYKPFIIAEMSGNHNHSLERALEIVDAAATAGADAIKLQTYTADTLTIKSERQEFTNSDKDSLWYGQNLYDLYSKAYTPWDWHEAIMERATELDLVCFSTPFDETAVDFLENLNVPAYKIASFENNHIPLIEKVASTGKPLFLSTGVSTISELDESIRVAREAGCRDLILLKCTSNYPATPENSNIMTIPHMGKLFDCCMGLSDHTFGIGAAIAAVAHGAAVIEKHFTLNRSDGGVDSAFSIEPNELFYLAQESERAWLSLGKVSYGPTSSESQSRAQKRSIYVVNDILAGQRLTTENIRCIRPGLGLEPKYYNLLLGKKTHSDLKMGTPMKWEYVLK